MVTEIRDTPDRPDPRHLQPLRGLGRCGTTESIPLVGGLLADGAVASDAAETLWLLTRDPDPIMPVLRRLLADRDARGQAVEVAGSMGEAARDLLPLLHAALGSSDRWLPFVAACAIGRITSQVTHAIEHTLRDSWTRERRCRDDIVSLLVDLGEHAAALHDLPRAELASSRRHLAVSGGGSDRDILDDEELLLPTEPRSSRLHNSRARLRRHSTSGYCHL